MRLKLALHRDVGLTRDIVVETDATATVADVVAEIVTTDPQRGWANVKPDELTLAAVAPGGKSSVTLDPERQLGEAPIASGFDVRIARRKSGDVGRHHAGGSPATLRVLDGPDAGREFALRPGSNIIGRDPSADVVLSDALVSRRHARVEVGHSVEVIDLNSANGILVDGGVVTRATLGGPQVATLGDSRIVVEQSATRPAPAAPPSEIQGGVLGINRSPVVEPRYPFTEHPRPEVPGEIDNPPFPWLIMIAPVLMGVAVYAITRNPLSLLFVALSPMMMAGNYLMTRMRNRRRSGVQIARFEKQLEALRIRLTADLPREHQVRNDEAPKTTRVIDAAMQLSPMLWTRRPEHWSFLHLRLGTGRDLSRSTVAAEGDRADGLPQYGAQLAELIDRFRYIDGVPIVESFANAGALGVAGPTSAAADVARALLSQVACLHSPAEVIIAGIAGPQGAHDFEWLKWLPHTSAPQSPLSGGHLAMGAASATVLLSQLEELVERRLGSDQAQRRGALATALVATAEGGAVGSPEQPAASIPLPAVILLIGADAPVERARTVQLAERCADAGIFTLWLAEQPADLPAVCRTFVDVSGSVATAAFVRHGINVRNIQPETTVRDAATALGRHLAALVDAGAATNDLTDLPQSVSTLSLLGQEMADDSLAVIERWRQNFSIHDRSGTARPLRRAGTLRALVGQSGLDAMHLDLRTHGPHALVGGTTGSGKSEFLQTWVLGMAAEYSPDRVTFLFVDYKGGAAFAECVDLPHCVGLVTDLSTHLVRRALTSLKAEVRRREDILRQKKAKDIFELEKRSDADCPPALVLVIDEFAALIGDVPDFVEGVVDIAQRGRSLGVNLIMATQRPAGVIRDNLRANTNLRIALRMADEADSNDVIGTPVASAFDPSIPGRAIAKTGPGRLIPFQGGFSGGWTRDEAPRPTITVSDLRFGADTEWEKPPPPGESVDQGPTDLVRLVGTISEAARQAQIPTPRRPWLNDLNRCYDLATLGPRTDAALIIGTADQPDKQEQNVVYFYPDIDGNLAIYGTGGSGKSVLLRTLAAGAGVTPRGGPVLVYGLDFAAGGLRMLEALPHVGSIISGSDTERVLRLLADVKAVADQRASTFPAVNATNIVEYRTAAARPDEPRILLLVDGFPAFRSEYEAASSRAIAYTTLQQLISEGRRLGIHVAFTADRPGGVPASIASSVPRRVVLRMADDAMYLVLDVPNDVLGPSSPPGRALIDGLETQVAVLGGSPNAADQFDALKRLAKAIEQQRPITAPEVAAMPTKVALSDLPATVEGLPVLGVSESDLLPVGFVDEGVLLLGGGPGSGRSTALAAIVAAVRRARPDRPFYYLGNRRSELPLGNHWAEVATTPTDVAELAKRLDAELAADECAPAVVVIESLSDFQGSAADAAIVALVRTVKRSIHFLIAESETSSWNSSMLLYAEVKSARRGLLLQPDTIEGDTILKTSFPRVSRAEFPPGRGFYAANGKVEKVQLPLPQRTARPSPL